jgi:hypothetical protein
VGEQLSKSECKERYEKVHETAEDASAATGGVLDILLYLLGEYNPFLEYCPSICDIPGMTKPDEKSTDESESHEPSEDDSDPFSEHQQDLPYYGADPQKSYSSHQTGSSNANVAVNHQLKQPNTNADLNQFKRIYRPWWAGGTREKKQTEG